MKVAVSLEKLLEAGAHFGHQARRWNPKMKPFLYTVQDGIHLFDLTKTKEKLEEALDVLKEAGKEGKTILFVGTKKQAKEKVEEVAKSVGSFYVTERWLGGTITNYGQIAKSCRKLTEMKKEMQESGYKSLTKKERVLIEREIERLKRFFGGIEDMEGLPDILIVVDTKREKVAVKEARMKDIQTVAVVDSNSDPTEVDYLIPMNDDATGAIDYVLDLIGEAILEGKSIKGKKGSKGTKRRVKPAKNL